MTLETISLDFVAFYSTSTKQMDFAPYEDGSLSVPRTLIGLTAEGFKTLTPQYAMNLGHEPIKPTLTVSSPLNFLEPFPFLYATYILK